MLSGCGFSTVISVKKKNIRRFIIRWKYGSKQAGETTIALLEQGMQEGVIRPVRIPILKMMLEASLEQFFQRDILLQNEITYAQALQEVVGILMYGIASER